MKLQTLRALGAQPGDIVRSRQHVWKVLHNNRVLLLDVTMGTSYIINPSWVEGKYWYMERKADPVNLEDYL